VRIVPECVVPACTRPERCKGLCASHYASKRQYPDVPRCPNCWKGLRVSEVCTTCTSLGVCLVTWCDKSIDCHGLCSNHAKPVVKRWLSTEEAIYWYENEVLCEGCKEAAATDLDHCHETGDFRGYLCGICNRTLGNLAVLTDVGVQNLMTYSEERGRR
jgi:hypothetical protein